MARTKSYFRKIERVFFKVLVILFLFFFSSSYGSGVENLYLSGYVRSFDRSTGILEIYVTTPGCEGPRQFLYPRDGLEDLDRSLIGKKIEFFINSPTCERGRIYQMIFR